MALHWLEEVSSLIELPSVSYTELGILIAEELAGRVATLLVFCLHIKGIEGAQASLWRHTECIM